MRKLVCTLILISPLLALGQEKLPGREYDPVVIYGSSGLPLVGLPVNEIAGYAYDAASGQWRAIPIQVDEVGPGEDAFFSPDDGLFDGNPEHPDEIAFMARDAGDRAPTDSWPEGVDPTRARIEVELEDTNTGARAYVYLYHKPGGFDPPDTYQMAYDAARDAVASRYYRLSFDSTIVLKDLAILPELGGDGRDLVDRQKIRLKFRALFQFFEINEELDIETRKVEAVAGPVRVIRRLTARLLVSTLSLDFHTTTRFYPFSMEAGAGKREFAKSLNISLIRQSLDLNENAVGMRFYNARNSGIVIDGNPDSPDRTLDVPGLNWILLTGPQGTIVSVLDVPKLGKVQALYYRDSASGDTDDDTQDTGDGKSYGDVGVKLVDQVAGEYDFASTRLYFLPPQQDPSVGAALVQNQLNPLRRNLRAQYPSGVAAREGREQPRAFGLIQAYPNPFSGRVWLSARSLAGRDVEIRIVDLRGRVVRTLTTSVDLSGQVRVAWDGRTAEGRELPAGIYFAQAIANDRVAGTVKLVRIR